jgi:HD-GYP domain-containing protein (c-di-GMP phosphodiesterase class II)
MSSMLRLSVPPYKPVWNLTDALEQLRAGWLARFDPACIDAMLQHLEAILKVKQRFAGENRPHDPSGARALARRG